MANYARQKFRLEESASARPLTGGRGLPRPHQNRRWRQYRAVSACRRGSRAISKLPTKDEAHLITGQVGRCVVPGD